MRPIRVLVVGMTATVGGIENFLMTYCGRIDRSRVQFDFLTRFADAAYPEKRDAIGKTYVIPKRSEDPVGFYREIRRFFRELSALQIKQCSPNQKGNQKSAQNL